jgi:hypothetical protein
LERRSFAAVLQETKEAASQEQHFKHEDREANFEANELAKQAFVCFFLKKLSNFVKSIECHSRPQSIPLDAVTITDPRPKPMPTFHPSN